MVATCIPSWNIGAADDGTLVEEDVVVFIMLVPSVGPVVEVDAAG